MEEEERLRAALLRRLAPAPPASEGFRSSEQSSRPVNTAADSGQGSSRRRGGQQHHDAGERGGPDVMRRDAESMQHAASQWLEEREAEVQWDALLSGQGREELDSLLFPPGAFIRAGMSLCLSL